MILCITVNSLTKYLVQNNMQIRVTNHNIIYWLCISANKIFGNKILFKSYNKNLTLNKYFTPFLKLNHNNFHHTSAIEVTKTSKSKNKVYIKNSGWVAWKLGPIRCLRQDSVTWAKEADGLQLRPWTVSRSLGYPSVTAMGSPRRGSNVADDDYLTRLIYGIIIWFCRRIFLCVLYRKIKKWSKYTLYTYILGWPWKHISFLYSKFSQYTIFNIIWQDWQ